MGLRKKQFLAALAVIFNSKGEVLVAKRNQPNLPDAHGKWELPGGGVEFGEDPLYALQREVHEESGLYVRVLAMIPKVFNNTWHHETYDSQVFLIGYVCEALSGKIASSDPEVIEPQWLDPRKVDYMNSLPGTEEIVREGVKLWKKQRVHSKMR